MSNRRGRERALPRSGEACPEDEADPRAAAASVDEAMGALRARAAAVRDAVARSIHRKRVPEIVFEVRREAGVDLG